MSDPSSVPPPVSDPFPVPPPDRFDFTAPVPPASSLGPVHFVAIGGSGMSGVARLFLARGIPVSGSDQSDSPTLRALEAAGARVHVGHDADHLGAAGTVIVSAAVRETNPELAAARTRGLRVLHRAQGIAALLAGAPAVAVAGANGKTTTSAMLTVALQSAGADPAYVIGSPIAGQGTSAAPGTGPMVIEADESDGSFLVYRPQVGVVLNITADHLDHYGDLAALQRAYAAFADTVADDGLLVAGADDAGTRALATRCRERGRPVLTWGETPAADLVLSGVAGSGRTWGADLLWSTAAGTVPAGTRARLVVPMPGRHNVHNAAAALLAATAGLGQPLPPVLAGLAAFPGTHRRFTAVGEVAGVEVVDDYAHNTDKVAALVRAGRSVTGGTRRLVIAFQPHLYSRTRDGAQAFAAALAPADVVAVLDVYGAREEPIEGVDSRLITGPLRVMADGPRLLEVPHGLGVLAVAPVLGQELRPGDLLITVGAGDVTTLGPAVLAELAARHTGGVG